MEIFNTIIQNTDTPEIQAMLANLNPEEDVLLTNENTEAENCIEVQYIEPINNIKTIGIIPPEIISSIREKYGKDVSIEISDYIITFDSGVYGLTADIVVNEIDQNDKPKSKRLPLPLLIIVGVATGILTAVLIIIKLITSLKKK